MTAGSGGIRELRSLGYRVELISPAPSAWAIFDPGSSVLHDAVQDTELHCIGGFVLAECYGLVRRQFRSAPVAAAATGASPRDPAEVLGSSP